MEYLVDCGIYYTCFETYREAEIFCCERGIHPENICINNEEEQARETLLFLLVAEIDHLTPNFNTLKC